MPKLTRYTPVLEHLKINVESVPALHEDEIGFAPQFGEAVDAPIIAVIIVWHFNTYDMLDSDDLCLEARVQQEHNFPKYVTVPAQVVRDMILTSFNESRKIYHDMLKQKEIDYELINLPDDKLAEMVESLCPEINHYLNTETNKGETKTED